MKRPIANPLTPAEVKLAKVAQKLADRIIRNIQASDASVAATAKLDLLRVAQEGYTLLTDKLAEHPRIRHEGLDDVGAAIRTLQVRYLEAGLFREVHGAPLAHN